MSKNNNLIDVKGDINDFGFNVSNQAIVLFKGFAFLIVDFL